MREKWLKNSAFLALITLALSGCAGNEALPSNATQTGAVTGALAGSIIGYNAKGHNKGKHALVGGLLGTALGAGVGSVIDQQNPEPIETGGWE